MKIYEYKIAPNPLRVQMFLSEKDINVETVQVDVRNGENRKEEVTHHKFDIVLYMNCPFILY